MRALLSGLGILSVLACIGGSMTMNYLYGASLGRTELESSVWGGLSIAFDTLKAGAPLYLVSVGPRRAETIELRHPFAKSG